MARKKLSFLHVVPIEDGKLRITTYRSVRDENDKSIDGTGTHRTCEFHPLRAKKHVERFCRAGMIAEPRISADGIWLSLWPKSMFG